MTRPTGSKLRDGGKVGTKAYALVLDGNEVKYRLHAERIQTQTPVHVDWLRFTVQRRLSKTPAADVLFPPSTVAFMNVWDEDRRNAEFTRILSSLPGNEFEASAQAMELGNEVAEALGPDFVLHPELRKGHDFYRHRFSIERNGDEVGWVGFLAASESPKQQAQAKTLHVNLYGSACTFAAHGWRDRIADVIEDRDGDITRADLALDFFDGLPGTMSMDTIVADYKAGVMDSGGKRLKCNMVGDWCNGAERSFYIGSKEAGKQTNIYEKGHQLFGRESGSPWTRIELRYGNKLRELPVDLLRRPADFFAGASDWHALMLSKADAIPAPEPITCTPRLEAETVQAEVSRNLRWLRDTAAATVAFAVNALGADELMDLIGTTKLPGRLRKFKPSELREATGNAMHRFFQPAAAGHGMQRVHPLAA